MSNWAGKTLGKVHIDSLLARGGMAEVYLGTHTTLYRRVVVKILHSHNEDDPALLERFQREARVVAKLRHPHIVQVFDFDTVDDQPYIVMEYVPGLSLSKYLRAVDRKMGRLELPSVSRILTGVASALQYAHESGVIHRDVKPGNILLTSRSSQIVPGEPLPPDFEPVLADFGLVRMLNASQQTTVGHIAGTPAYMSPEQARAEQTDGRTDIYSLGIILYQLLAGNVPFDGESTISVLLQHVTESPAPIPRLSAPLQSVLDRALAKDPAERFQTPNEFAAALNAVIEESSEASTIVELATPLPPARKTGYRAKLRKGWIPATLTAVAIIAIGAFSLLNAFSPFWSTTPATSSTAETPVTLISSALGPTGILRFEDGTAVMDQVTLTALAMPAPPEGSQYEAWLVDSDGEARRNLGILIVDENGKGILTYNDRQDQNLLAHYDRVEVTLRSETDSNPDRFQQVAYSYALPAGGLEYVRRLLVSFPLAPERVALIQGLYADTRSIDQTAKEMLRAYANGDEAATRKSAEAMMNLLVGEQSPDYKDWNDDGQITNPGDGYGFWRNGDHLGYIPAVYSHADYAANSPGVSQNMIVNGERVKTCAQNLAQWAPQLRERILTILTSASLADMADPIREAVALADQMLNGIDQNDNGKIEPASGECGVLTAYDHAYRMADMPLLPVNSLDTLIATGTASPTTTIIIGGPTSTSGGSSSNTSIPNPQPTKKPKNTPKPGNTHKPP